MKIVKRSVRIARHNTSLSLEAEFWDELKRLAHAQKLSLNQLVAKIDGEDGRTRNLSSALRLYVLRELKSALRRAE
jgi:predicted DNA-binding ribbon-helix-helix protein